MPEFDPQRLAQLKGNPSKLLTDGQFDPEKFAKIKGEQYSKQESRYPIGPLIGSIALPWLAPGVGTLASIGLGALGAGGGEAYQQLIERAMGKPVPKTSSEAAKQIGEQTAWQVGGDLLGRGMLKGVSKIISPFGKTMTPEGSQAIKFMAQRGVQPGILPAEATSSRVLDFLHNIAEHGIFGADKIASYKAMRGTVLKQTQDDILNSIAKEVTPDQAARHLIDSVKGNLDLARNPSKMIYQAIDKAAAITKPSPVPSVSPFAMPKIQSSSPIIEIGDVKRELSSLISMAKKSGGLEDRAMGTSLLNFIESKPNQVPYSVAKQIRTEVRALKDMLEKTPETKNAPGIGVAKLVYSKLTDAIEGGLKKYDPFLSDMWKDANFLERAAQAQYNPKIVRALMQKAMPEFKADPASLVKTLQGLGPEPLKIWRNAVGSDAWKDFQRVTAEGIMTKGSSLGELEGARWLEKMFGTGPGARAKMEAIFDPSQIKSMEEFGKVLKTIQSKEGGKEGTVWVQLKQAQAIGAAGALGAGFLSGHPEVGELSAMGILVTPAALGYIMTHPQLSKWFTNAIQLPAGSQVAASSLGKILAAIPATYTQPLSLSQPQAPLAQPPTPTGTTLRPLPLQQ